MGFFDLGYGGKRASVQKTRERENKESLRFRTEERKREKRERKLKAKTREILTERDYLRAKAEKKAAKRGTSFTLPTFKIKKKKQGRKLSRRRSVRLI